HPEPATGTHPAPDTPSPPPAPARPRTPRTRHRHWRNARTRTPHDPARWKVQRVGHHVPDGTTPPRHGLR
ncbi:hypothetical protein AB0B95_39420, partial [Streptomyces hygroscopicus]|uniref:hypothetical protein n=1 Tax=Streptomyces hygroscopicus TaxID=1912 RepID=UPI0033E047D1